MADVYKISVGT